LKIAECQCEECFGVIYVEQTEEPEWCPFCKTRESLIKSGVEVTIGVNQ
jgi:Zn finger protein HypA/HybF involved in hydrogenase expression